MVCSGGDWGEDRDKSVEGLFANRIPVAAAGVLRKGLREQNERFFHYGLIFIT